MRVFNIILIYFACNIIYGTENLGGSPNTTEQEKSKPPPTYEIKDKIDKATFSTARSAIDALQRPNQSHYGVSDDPKLKEKMAETDRKIAQSYESMFNECERFMSFQGGLVSFLKVVIFISCCFLIFKAGAFMYKGEMPSALEIIMGLGALVIVVIFLGELMGILQTLI